MEYKLWLKSLSELLMVTFLSFGQQNLIIVNNDVTTIATQCYRFCDFVDFSFLPFIILWWLSNRWKKAIMVFLQNEATRSTPSLPLPLLKKKPSKFVFEINWLINKINWLIDKKKIDLFWPPRRAHLPNQCYSSG